MRIFTTLFILAAAYRLTFCQPDTLWTNTFSWSTMGYWNSDRGVSLVEQDDGYVIGGCSYAMLLDTGNPLLIKTDISGDSLWGHGYEFELYGALLSSMIETWDGGFAMTGGTWCLGVADWMYLLKTDENGDTLWMQTYEEYDFSNGISVKQTEEGGYIIIGQCYDYAGDDGILLVRTSADGDLLWSRLYGTDNNGVARDILITEDLGYFILAEAEPIGSNDKDIWLIRTDFTGDTLWTKTYGDTLNDYAVKIIHSQDDNYIIVGTSPYFAGGSGIFLLKIDEEGELLWTNSSTTSTVAKGICSTADGGYAVCGATSITCDWYIMKTDSLGIIEWDMVLGGASYDCAYDIIEAEDGNLVVTGSYIPPDQYDSDVWLVKISPDGVLVDPPDWVKHPAFQLYQPFPNPFNPETVISFELPEAMNITLSIYNVKGQLVESLAEGSYNAGAHSLTWNAKQLPSGVYFSVLHAAGNVQTRKMVLMK